MVVKKSFEDDIASSMSAMLDDREYQKVFNAPTIKTASRNDDLVKKAFNDLVKVSSALDDLGLHKSSTDVLRVIAQLMMDGVSGDEMPIEALDEIATEQEFAGDIEQEVVE